MGEREIALLLYWEETTGTCSVELFEQSSLGTFFSSHKKKLTCLERNDNRLWIFGNSLYGRTVYEEDWADTGVFGLCGGAS